MQAGLAARPLSKGREPIVYPAFRNKTRNGIFAVNQRAVSGTVVLSAGAYGHDGWKAGAAGCTYTFALVNGLTILTIVSGSLLQVIEDRDIEAGIYCLSWTGSAQGRFAGGSYSATGTLSTALASGSSLTVEFAVGTLTKVQVELGLSPTPFERRHIAAETALCTRYAQWVEASWRGSFPIVSGIADIPLNWSEMRVTPTATPTAGTGYVASNVSGDVLSISQKTGGRWEIQAAGANTDSFVLNRRFFLTAEL